MSALIAALDRGLAVAGEDIKLRLTVGTANRENVDVNVRSAVRSPTVQEVAGGIPQADFFCILSPSEINRQQWPGGQLPAAIIDDPRIPKKGGGYSAFVRGRWREVQWGQGFYPSGELCRIEIRVEG